jgi:hypothetical protein
MKDIDGNEVQVGDTVRVLRIDDDFLNGCLTDDERVHHLAMLDNDYVIDGIVEEGTKVSISIEWECDEGISMGGLHMLPSEFRLQTRHETVSDEIFYLVNPGLRPVFHVVADHIWGVGANVDSDGNSGNADDVRWTELSLYLRDSEDDQEVHIDPVSQDPLVLKIRSSDAALANKTVKFLHQTAGGFICSQWPCRVVFIEPLRRC